MAIIGLFQCDPTQNWLKNATNDISIQEFHNVTRHYVKDTGLRPSKYKYLPNIIFSRYRDTFSNILHNFVNYSWKFISWYSPVKYARFEYMADINGGDI